MQHIRSTTGDRNHRAHTVWRRLGPETDSMSELSAPSYYALRVRPRAHAPKWWASARDAAAAPPAITGILAGRSRVEVSAEEAVDALAWARELPGWDDDSLAPLWAYPTAPAGS